MALRKNALAAATSRLGLRRMSTVLPARSAARLSQTRSAPLFVPVSSTRRDTPAGCTKRFQRRPTTRASWCSRRMIAVWVIERQRSPIISKRSRSLSLKRRYHGTHRVMTSRSKCRPSDCSPELSNLAVALARKPVHSPGGCGTVRGSYQDPACSDHQRRLHGHLLCLHAGRLRMSAHDSFETNDNRFDQNHDVACADDFVRYMIDCFDVVRRRLRSSETDVARAERPVDRPTRMHRRTDPLPRSCPRSQ